MRSRRLPALLTTTCTSPKRLHGRVDDAPRAGDAGDLVAVGDRAAAVEAASGVGDDDVAVLRLSQMPMVSVSFRAPERYSRSMMVTLACPPPSHMVCNP
jgi:hypothetical protein